MTARPLYGFRFDRDAEGVFYVKQHAEGGDMIAITDVAQDRRRFATWQEAQTPALAWEKAANDPRVYPVCNPMYQERRLDGVLAHLEYDPKHGTILVPDSACKDRAALDAVEMFQVRMAPGEETYTAREYETVRGMVADAARDLEYGTPCLVCGAPIIDGIDHDVGCMVQR